MSPNYRTDFASFIESEEGRKYIGELDALNRDAYISTKYAIELIASRRLIERVRRWVSDHPIDPDHPCHCGLCTALRRYDSEVGQ